MKRRIFTIIVILLLGAIVNVVVAWGCCLWRGEHRTEWLKPSAIDRREVSQSPIPEFLRDVHLKALPESSSEYELRILRDRLAVGWSESSLDSAVPGSDEQMVRDFLLLAGWPTHSLWGHWQHVMQVDLQPRMTGLAFWPQYHSVPYRPLWPGFAINTLFYAGILWLVVAAPLALRRRRRITHGLCPACAYPVGTSLVCTECGREVHPNADGKM